MTKNNINNSSSPPAYLRRLGNALITNILLFFLLVYVNTGYIFYIPEGAISTVWVEFSFFYIFLVALFWTHARIAEWIRLPFFSSLPAVVKLMIETIFVIALTLLLNLVLVYLPISFILGFENTPEGRVRTVTVISVIISLFFYYFIEREMSRKKLQAEQLRTEQLQKENFKAQLEYLKAQMDPHFLFNSLNVLNSLIYVDQKKASEFTQQLAYVYRSFLDKTEESLIRLTEEMELIHNYVGLLKTRFGEEVIFSIEVRPQDLNFFVPPGAVQLLVENAIKHNAFTERSPLSIEIITDGEKLTVRNNIQERKELIPSVGHGLHNIQSRYEFLTDKEVLIKNTGKEFTVSLPLIEKNQHGHTDR